MTAEDFVISENETLRFRSTTCICIGTVCPSAIDTRLNTIALAINISNLVICFDKRGTWVSWRLIKAPVKSRLDYTLSIPDCFSVISYLHSPPYFV